MKYQEVEGDLIKMALNNEFDVITHGCNCMCTMSAGIAVPMKKTFKCDLFPLESEIHKGSINKLGQIDCKDFYFGNNGLLHIGQTSPNQKRIIVINSYTQLFPNAQMKPLDYEALTLCLRKINHIFKGLHIGLPKIGCGLAGGDWNRVKEIIKTELKDCDITIVIYKK